MRHWEGSLAACPIAAQVGSDSAGDGHLGSARLYVLDASTA
jgi:hypothetical protein